MTTPTPPADDQPGSVEVSERDREVAIQLLTGLVFADIKSPEDVERLYAQSFAAYRREIEGWHQDQQRKHEARGKAILEVLDALRPQAMTVNPSLLAVRLAVRILQREST